MPILPQEWVVLRSKDVVLPCLTSYRIWTIGVTGDRDFAARIHRRGRFGTEDKTGLVGRCRFGVEDRREEADRFAAVGRRSSAGSLAEDDCGKNRADHTVGEYAQHFQQT